MDIFRCNDCPRKCNALRTPEGGRGFCMSGSSMRIARAAPHFGEEPCISGLRGSGTIFFTGCNLRCIFCQNYEISRPAAAEQDSFGTESEQSGCGKSTARNNRGKERDDCVTAVGAAVKKYGRDISVQELRDIMLRLEDTGVHNINLVTPTHFTRQIAEALSGVSLSIPVAWNSSGYESVESLKLLDGLVQIYMPDYKYASRTAAKKYSAAEDYPEIAAAALKEMFRQRGAYTVDRVGMLTSGLLIRHLILPDGNVQGSRPDGQDGGLGLNTSNSMDVIDFLADTFPENSILFSLMSQYTPMPAAERFEELRCRVTEEQYDLLRHYMKMRRLENGYYQDICSATGEMIPVWE